MGADTFICLAKGEDATEAFRNAIQEAYWDCGHGGYTGTIAEKASFIMLACPEGVDPLRYAEDSFNDSESPVDSKWGPAGCIALPKNEFLFFGWASC